nr:uncharacterized protein DKFZp434B061-like [Aegilops tauschii subsp. strangulata]
MPLQLPCERLPLLLSPPPRRARARRRSRAPLWSSPSLALVPTRRWPRPVPRSALRPASARRGPRAPLRQPPRHGHDPALPRAGYGRPSPTPRRGALCLAGAVPLAAPGLAPVGRLQPRPSPVPDRPLGLSLGHCQVGPHAPKPLTPGAETPLAR